MSIFDHAGKDAHALRGRPTTTRIDAITPSHAKAGRDHPPAQEETGEDAGCRRRRTSRRDPSSSGSVIRYAPSAAAEAASGASAPAAVASQSRPSGCCRETAPITPSRDPTGHGQHRQVRVLVARDRVQRHAEDEGAEAAEQLEHEGRSHVGRMLGHVREPRGDPLPAGRPARQDHSGQGGGDVDEKREPGHPGVGPASHVSSPLAEKGSLPEPYESRRPGVRREPAVRVKSTSKGIC